MNCKSTAEGSVPLESANACRLKGSIHEFLLRRSGQHNGRTLPRVFVLVAGSSSGQHAVVRDTLVRGETVTRVECVRGGAVRSAEDRAPYLMRYRAERPHRSWARSALIIGGAAGTGAGIGGIVHGGKGALIGAALGGGAASLYEGARRR